MISGRPTIRTIPTRVLGAAGLIWALAYVPIHVYWALGGTSAPIGITGAQSGFRAANWGACVVIVGAGLTCLSLTRRWGEALPGGLRRGVAWVGGLCGLAHWLLYTTFCALRVAGVVGYPIDADASPRQLRAFDWANLGYFELWFGVMGALLIICAMRSAALDRLSPRPPVRPIRRVGIAASLAGLAVLLWGVFTFDPWTFAGLGPAVLGVGLLLSFAPPKNPRPGGADLAAPPNRQSLNHQE
ncbi:MAG TPA: hypothetical protein VGI21_06785 [Streptosporangiaceae bacterium]|jgi:hypothetical protein